MNLLIALATEHTGTRDTVGKTVRNIPIEAREVGRGKLELEDKLLSLHQIRFEKSAKFSHPYIVLVVSH